MKKIIVNLIVILFNIFAYSTNAQIYMMGVAPLEQGNLWKYLDIGWLGGQSNFFVSDSNVTLGGINYKVVEVFKDGSTIRHKRYLGFLPDNYFAKYDTLSTDSVYKYYKNDCKIGDNWMENISVLTFYYSVIDTFSINAWGKTLFSRVIKITDYSLVEVYQVWADSIGLMEENSIGQYHMILRGCVIDGIVYGDTTTVDVEDEFKLPKGHMLLQNYPNPFNPATNIIYQIKESGQVQLKVYDILGKEIVTLVNEEKPEGIYSVQFDASNLPSGVYIYTLKVNDFTASKKMAVVK